MSHRYLFSWETDKRQIYDENDNGHDIQTKEAETLSGSHGF